MSIAENLHRVQQRVAEACRAAGRDSSEVRLLPVSKTWPAASVREIAAAGVTMVGENRVQEAKHKAAELADVPVGWSIIGHLQTNKAKDVVAFADELQSLDSLRLATELERRMEQAGGLRGTGRPLPVFLQVNTSGEDTKSGIDPTEALSLARDISSFDWLRPMGLMTIAANSSEQQVVADNFRVLRELRERIRDDDRTGPDELWQELSMGMSGDIETAIAEGSTVVRVGRAIFGDRAPLT